MLMLRELRFIWWNVCDFAHFDPAMAERDRWPSSHAMFQEKLRRIDQTLTGLYGDNLPELIGLCEMTREAAKALRIRRLHEYEVIFSKPRGPDEFQIVVFMKSNVGLRRKPPLFAEDVPKFTRPMLIAELLRNDCHLRFAFCHWPAFEEPVSDEHRGRVASTLRRDVYKFMKSDQGTIYPKEYLALGDFNIEPFNPIFEMKLYASRDRDRARQKPHYTDEDVGRVRLYNCGWRHLGEEHPHRMEPGPVGRTGTYFQASTRIWRTFDQLLVTGGLLTGKRPALDETQLLVRSNSGILEEVSTPRKFEFVNGVGTGISDHFPISGTLLLS